MSQTLEIIIVDDEPQITELLRSFVEIFSGESNVHTFNDPLEAKDFMGDNRPDILITDYKMPGLDGIELLKSADQSVRKVMISGYLSEIATEQLQRLDVTCMEKPVAMQKLGDLIADVQDQKKVSV